MQASAAGAWQTEHHQVRLRLPDLQILQVEVHNPAAKETWVVAVYVQ